MKYTKVLALVLIVAVALAVFAAVSGCGSKKQATATTTADKWQQILGHAPTGLAATILSRGYIEVANDANYPPQSSVDKTTGQLVGFDVDVAKKMGALLGLPVKFQNPAWETIMNGLNQGSYDVSIGSMTSAVNGSKTATSTVINRWKHLDFTPPYYYATGQLFVKKGGPQVTSADQLAGKTVGVGAATTYYDWLKSNTKAIVKTYATDADAFPDLRNGNLDFVMTAGTTGQQAILQGQPFEFSGPPLYYESLSMGIKKGEADWLTLLDYTVSTMHNDGSLTAMSKQWYNGLDLTTLAAPGQSSSSASPTP